MLLAIMRYLPILLAALVMAVSQPVASAPAAPHAKTVTAPGKACGPAKPAKPPKADDKAKPPAPPAKAAKPEDKPKPPAPPPKPDKPPKADPPKQAKKGDPTPKTTPKKPLVPDQDAAQKAVALKQALPLAKIIAIAATHSAGRVINARLVQINSVLLYQLTLLDEAGRSWREYYHASSGNPVVLP